MSDTAAPAPTVIDGTEMGDALGPAPVGTDDAPAAESGAPTDSAQPRRKTRKELEAEVNLLRGEVARLRAGEEPVAPHDPISTGGHLLWVLGHASAEMRVQLAALMIRSLKASAVCDEQGHARRIAFLDDQVKRQSEVLAVARAEVKRLDRTSGTEGRAVALALTYSLLPDVH